VPATFGVLTTIATFGPLLSVPGSFGAIPAAIGWVVILCLAFSIIESKLILPAHLSSMRSLPKNDTSPIRRIQDLAAGLLEGLRDNHYRRLLDVTLHYRYVTAASFLAMLILAVGFVIGPYIKIVMMPNMSMGFVMARVELVDGASASQVVRVLKEVSDKLEALNDSQPADDKFLVNVSAFTSGSTGRITADVKSHPGLNTEQLASEWRELVGEIAGTQNLEFVGAMRASGQSGDVGFALIGTNPQELDGARELLEETLRGYAGVFEIRSSGRGSIPEVNLSIKPSA
jgi:multidrug efflux pump subunit AcrB